MVIWGLTTDLRVRCCPRNTKGHIVLIGIVDLEIYSLFPIALGEDRPGAQLITTRVAMGNQVGWAPEAVRLASGRCPNAG